MRTIMIIITTLALLLGASTPAQARPHSRDVAVVVTASGSLGEGARAAVRMWGAAQDRYRLQLADRCPRRGDCITVGEVWDAWGGYILDGIEYGGWSERSGRRCTVGLPTVLTSPALVRRWDLALTGAGASRGGLPAEVWPAFAVAGHELGHCVGLPDRPDGAGVMAPLGDLTLSAEDLASLSRRR